MYNTPLDEYEKEAVSLALANCDYAEVCVDTVRKSYEEGKTPLEAAEAIIDDTMYWAGDWLA